MRHAVLPLLLAATLATPAVAQEPQTRPQPMPRTADPMPQTAQEALRDIEKTFGMVPGFFRMFPESALPGAWGVMKAVQADPDSAIPAKNKELIGLAVAAQIPCDYCVYFHTQAAKLHGATQEEIELTLAEAALTQFMATYLGGTNVDLAQYRKDLSRALEQPERRPTAGRDITNAASARADIEQTFGFVPEFFAKMPDDVLPALWQEKKAVEMTPGPIPDKYVLLTSLAVSSQIPCETCVYTGRQIAQSKGVSPEEIDEAIIMAATVRHWSTYLNGVRYDERTFRREVDKMVKTLARQQKRNGR